MIRPGQIRAARALLDWTQRDLAERTGLEQTNLLDIERGRSSPRQSTLQRITDVFYIAGIDFLPNDGVARRDDTLTVLEGDDVIMQMLDDVYETCLKPGGEVLQFFVDNAISPPEVVAAEKKRMDAGIKTRSIISDTYTILNHDKSEYRCIPNRYFVNKPQMVYGNKIANILLEKKKIYIFKDEELSSTQRHLFNLIWDSGHEPL